MGTLVCFHAHPDDEAIATGGSMARAHAEGHRVVLVVATDGRHGETPDDLAPDETLIERRQVETQASAEVLGVDRVVFLGYADSGMTGWEQNDAEGSFHGADLDEAAARLADVLRNESADVLTIYDWHGNYGHPDHVKVHTVGTRAAELVVDACPQLRVFEATVNRDALIRMMEAARTTDTHTDDEAVVGLAEGVEGAADAEVTFDFDPTGPADDGNPFGMPEAELTHEVDVREYVGAKRAAIACHRSQVTDSSFFLSMPPDQFTAAFGYEWFIEHGRQAGMRPGWLFDDPAA